MRDDARGAGRSQIKAYLRPEAFWLCLFITGSLSLKLLFSLSLCHFLSFHSSKFYLNMSELRFDGQTVVVTGAGGG